MQSFRQFIFVNNIKDLIEKFSVWMKFFLERNKIIPKSMNVNLINTIQNNYEKTIPDNFNISLKRNNKKKKM